MHSSVPVPLDDGICRDSVQKWGHFFTFTWQQLRTAPTFPYKFHRGKAGLLRLRSKEKDHNVQWASTLNSWGKSAGRRRAASLPHPFFFCVCVPVRESTFTTRPHLWPLGFHYHLCRQQSYILKGRSKIFAGQLFKAIIIINRGSIPSCFIKKN